MNLVYKRHAAYYAKVLMEVSQMYLTGNALSHQILQTLDQELANIRLGQERTASCTSTSQETATLCITYAKVSFRVLQLRQSPQERIQWAEAALRAARYLQDSNSECSLLGELGYAFLRMEDMLRAIELLQAQLATAREIKNRRAECSALGNLGVALRKHGETTQARSCLEQALVIAREEGNLRHEMTLLAELAIALRYLKSFDEGLRAGQQSHSIAIKLKDAWGESSALSILGAIHLELGSLDSASDFFSQALSIERQLGNDINVAIGLWNLAEIAEAMGERRQAIQHAESSLEIRERIKDTSVGTREVRNQLKAWRQLPRTKIIAASLRHARFYLEILQEINELYPKNNELILNGQDLYKNNIPNIVLGQQHAQQFLDDTPEAARLCVEYASRGNDVLAIRLPAEQRIVWLETGLRALSQVLDEKSECMILNNLSIAYCEKGDSLRAIDFGLQSLKLAETIHWHEGRPSILNSLGVGHWSIGEWELALSYFEQAANLAHEHGQWQREGKTLSNMGMIWKERNDFARAITYYHRAIEVAKLCGDEQGAANAFGNLGIVYDRAGNQIAAVESYERQLEIVRRIKDVNGRIRVLNNLGLVYVDQDRLDDAFSCYQEALPLAKAMENLLDEGNVLSGLGAYYAKKNKFKLAFESYNLALDLARDCRAPILQGIVLNNLSEIFYGLKDDERAFEHAHMALDIFEQFSHPYAAAVREQIATWKADRDR